jgi:hypothetical protein
MHAMAIVEMIDSPDKIEATQMAITESFLVCSALYRFAAISWYRWSL